MGKGIHYYFLYLSLFYCLLSNTLNQIQANDQVTNFYKLLKSKKSPSIYASWVTLPTQIKETRAHVEPQHGLMEADKITALPGQPKGVDFDQYAGYVTVDPANDKTLFYYFVESPENAFSKPLVLWLNGGPGCSSVGNGAFMENGPFRVRRNQKKLYRNPYAWNNVANVIYLESPAGVGFSYGDVSTIYNQTGDISTAIDSYIFLINWFERFPRYKGREFYLTGESYAGHFLPQLAQTILYHNKMANNTFINLNGIAMGNAAVDDYSTYAGIIDYLWSHAIISDQTHTSIHEFCNFSNIYSSEKCLDYYIKKAGEEMGNIDVFNIYAPKCNIYNKPKLPESVENFDPCTFFYVDMYINNKKVRKALHTKEHPKFWSPCNPMYVWHDTPLTVLPLIKELLHDDIRIWMFSGDIDERVPVTATRYSINALNLPIKTSWRPWRSGDNEVGGYLVEYEGLVFATVREAEHQVPSHQPERALTLFSSFLQGTLPPRLV